VPATSAGSRRARGSRALPALVLAGVLAGCEAGPARVRGVLVVSIDTLRRDHVGLHGYPRPTTPRLDTLGAEAVVFDDAVSVSSWTLPAHLSMFTSLTPAAHGGVDRRHGYDRRIPTLPEALRRAGFATHAVTSHLYLSEAYGLDAGFDTLDYAYDRKAIDVAGRAIEALDRIGDRGFFLFLHFYDPHRPYAPPPRALRHFETGYAGSVSGAAWDLTPEQMPAADLAHLIALYDGEIRFADAQLGRVLDHLRRRGLDSRTLVIVTSDHGEEFGEHGNWEHQYTLYEELVRIPLVVRAPGRRPRREPAQASLLDVAPTVLDALGLPPLPGQRGRSLLGPLGPREAYGETEYGRGGTRRLFLRGGASGFKLILGLDRKTGAPRAEEWFDLARDPGEKQNAPPAASVADPLRRRLIETWQETRVRGAAPEVALDAQQREQLRALGYVE
jgi:arylsulfatase A-like enzyme